MANLVRCCFDDTGTLAMICVLDAPYQLADPAFNPKHLTIADIHKDDYFACARVADIVEKAHPALAKINPKLADIVAIKIADTKAQDAANEKAAAEYAAWVEANPDLVAKMKAEEEAARLDAEKLADASAQADPAP